MELDMLAGIGLSIVTATALALAAQRLKQPLLLAYLLAGILLGPNIGFGLIHDRASIEGISKIGLVLLLYIIGLEIDLKKLLSAGKSLLLSGIFQVLLSVPLGIGFFILLGFPLGGGRFDALYLAVALAFSSTMIVVKLLYDKGELPTLPGRLTLGILVFQDLWAIVFLSVQPNLLNPEVGTLLLSFVKGAALVVCSVLLARYVLVHIFAFIARIPELLLVTAIAWCFLVSGAAELLGISREMGALVAGVSLSTFPYNVDVIAKVINIRDFFVTLFFVGLGLQIPMPTPALIGYALVTSAFLLVTRFLTVTTVLYPLRNGLRASLLPAINLAQMSEFSLVIVSMGMSMGHLDAQVAGILTFVFAIMSIASTYLIKYNHAIQNKLAGALRRVGLKDLDCMDDEAACPPEDRDIVFLGFFRETSSIFHELSALPPHEGRPLDECARVVDFSPVVHAELQRRGVPCTYGDISSPDTLHHAEVSTGKIIVCSISDVVLRGTNNRRLLQSIRRICPEAFIVVTADTIKAALELYKEGADFVFIPRLHSARRVAEVVASALARAEPVREAEMDMLASRHEVLA